MFRKKQQGHGYDMDPIKSLLPKGKTLVCSNVSLQRPWNQQSHHMCKTGNTKVTQSQLVMSVWPAIGGDSQNMPKTFERKLGFA